MKKLFDKSKGQTGMVTIEATLALTTFLFAFLMIYSLINICRAQAGIQVALNNTAQEISQYSYIYGLSRLDQSLAGFQEEAGKEKSEVNGLVKQTITVFDGIQTLGGHVSEVDVSSVDLMLSSWDTISADLQKEETDMAALKSQIEAMAKDPQKLLFGMAKLLGSEALEVAKSRLIAEPVTRALIKKHLKRTENDTAEAFCKSVGIVPGSYLGTTSCFNGIDFSSSTLFPYGSEEITLIATYKVKIMQLLPIDLEFTITQSAVTRGWLHGDKTASSAAVAVEKLKEDPESSVWNSYSINQRNSIIRGLELDELKKSGYLGVSSETYVQAYHEATNTFALIAMCNPIYGIDSADKIDKAAVTDDVKRIAAEIMSATDVRQKVVVKEMDAKGNMVNREIDVSKSPINRHVVLVVPEDTGVEECVKSVVKELGYSGLITVKKAYGTGYKLPEKKPSAEGEEKP